MYYYGAIVDYLIKSKRSRSIRLFVIFHGFQLAALLCQGQTLNDPINKLPDRAMIAPTLSLETPQGRSVPPTPTLIETPINADFLARAAVVGDTTLLADFASGAFVPSAIPVAGQPFFGSPNRTNLQANGSAVRINAYGPSSDDYVVAGHAELMLRNASFPSSDASNPSFTIRQLIGTLNRITLGVSDSVFSDPSALPETLDLAGPNSRVTVYGAGVDGNQGILSYDFFSDTNEGFKLITSVETAKPLIHPALDTDQKFSQAPDFVCSAQYVEGGLEEGKFAELWHLQFATVFRDLGIESPNTDHQNVFGWGTALSGAYRFPLFGERNVRDRVMFSVVYGEGISHYIADLNAATDTGDAVENAAGVLVPLPAFGCYGAITHNWTDCLRSTITLSHVRLDSIPAINANLLPSPYLTGDFLAVNLVHHSIFFSSEKPDAARQNFFMGIEYLVGRKETLDGQRGDAQRVIFEVAVSR